MERNSGVDMNFSLAVWVKHSESQLCPSLSAAPYSIKLCLYSPFFLINKHYHRLTDYQLVLAISCSLIPGPPVHYRSFTMSITAKTASLHYKTTITALFTTALATNNHAKWQKGGKQMIKQFEFLSSHLCIWQMLLSKASYTAFKVYIYQVPGNETQDFAIASTMLYSLSYRNNQSLIIFNIVQSIAHLFYIRPGHIKQIHSTLLEYMQQINLWI